ncbi:TetR/AcrR family transcriptional regulator [Actinoplanes flavus]|nr:TetR family transcriptional regulator [Actinoplanes flavus]
MASLRDRKRARTRQALVEVAADLFERQGYDETTVAQIAAGAEIGTRTFFSYFPGKEHLVFPETDRRVHAALEAIDQRGPKDGPAEVLLRALRRVGDDSDDLSERLAALRLRLIREVPAVQGLSLRIQLDAQRQIATHLAAAFPERLDEVRAAALTGAFVGAVTGALQVLLEREESRDDPAAVQRALQEAVDAALAPWFSGAGSDRSDH